MAILAPAGTCFGFSVRSAVALGFTRSGADGPPLTITEGDNSALAGGQPIIERHREGRPFIRVHDHGDRFGVWFDEVGWFGVDAQGGAIQMPASASGPMREMRLWGIPSALCFIARGDHSLHGAALDVGDGAIVVAAPGRFGKSTLAAGFVRSGARLLSEDLSCCRLAGDPAILPGPAVLRLRHDVAADLELPRTTVVGADDERVFVTIDEDARGDGAPVPLRAIVLLREHDAAPRLERVEPAKALPDLYMLSFKLPDDADRARCFAGVTALAATVPVWNVYRRLSVDALQETVALIRSTCAPPQRAERGSRDSNPDSRFWRPRA